MNFIAKNTIIKHKKITSHFNDKKQVLFFN